MPSNIYQPKPSTLKLNAHSGNVGLDQAVYVNTNESLQVTAVSSIGANSAPTGFIGVTCSVDIRMLTTANGLVYLTFVFVPPSDYSVNHFNIKIPEGFLLNINAYSTGQTNANYMSPAQTPLIGQMWVSLALVATTEPNQYTATYLCQGYITNQQRIAYPPRLPLSYEDGCPFMRFSQLAGGITYVVPQNAIDEITGVTFSLTTDATAGNRTPVLTFNSSAGATQRTLQIPFAIQAPSTTTFYQAWMGAPQGSSAVGQTASLPYRFRMRPTDTINVGIVNNGSSDHWANLTVWGNEWLVP